MEEAYFFPFRKNTYADVALSQLKRGPKRNVEHLIAKVSIQDEIDHNRGYLQEIDYEIDEIIRYLDEIRMTKLYLKQQVIVMEKEK